jgi:inorganic pyrophosphatase
VLPAEQRAALREAVRATANFAEHTWRDTAPINDDGTINAYVEIPRDGRIKWEYDIASNARVVDRTLHDSIDGYPTNYGYLPASFAFDGDPYDVLVLGPRLRGGDIALGQIVGIMYMDDEQGADPKLVISPVDEQGNAAFELTDAERARIGRWFDDYKKPEAAQGKWSKVQGWGDADEGHRSVEITTGFFDDAVAAAPPDGGHDGPARAR